jgi:hypothetical protein
LADPLAFGKARGQRCGQCRDRHPLLRGHADGRKQWLCTNVIAVLPRLGIGLGLGVVALIVDHVLHDGLAIVPHEIMHVHRP